MCYRWQAGSPTPQAVVLVVACCSGVAQASPCFSATVLGSYRMHHREIGCTRVPALVLSPGAESCCTRVPALVLSPGAESCCTRVPALVLSPGA
jgi:hypothetical protein